jgi:NADH-quinone oxidoreductase subunit L
MMLVVTGVGTLIHIYAIGYMRGDPRYPRFFVYMNLFLVAMLALVTADNYLVMFAGWEGVGLCSYLLIGFWFDKGEGVGWKNSNAARKAFIVNRIGDFGLMMALFLLFWTFGTLDFGPIFEGAETTLAAGAPVALLIAFFLLLGATGKSAQIPLFVWLPDAMAGPTPVSALIHAATMVTAGIYLVARSHVLFALAPGVQALVTLIGALTALFAATVAAGQWDIKRVLAYSTISQLGFMIAAVGLGAYVAALFHLITHAFFKALLFLSAGSVIHGVEHGQHHAHSEEAVDAQDMRVMGGLRARMPLTFWVYVVGAAALAGIPPLSGFFSKDEILLVALQGNTLAYVLLTAAAFCTAFYMGRQVWLVFFGQARTEAAAQAVESQRVMTAPLIVLAVLAVVGGALNLPGGHTLATWLSHTLGEVEAEEFSLTVAGISVALALLGILLAYLVYRREPVRKGGTDPLARPLGRLYRAIDRRWWIDEVYARYLVRPFQKFGQRLAKDDIAAYRDLEIGADGALRRVAVLFSRIQTGHLNWNVAGLVGGLIIVLAVLFLSRGV